MVTMAAKLRSIEISAKVCFLFGSVVYPPRYDGDYLVLTAHDNFKLVAFTNRTENFKRTRLNCSSVVVMEQQTIGQDDRTL